MKALTKLLASNDARDARMEKLEKEGSQLKQTQESQEKIVEDLNLRVQVLAKSQSATNEMVSLLSKGNAEQETLSQQKFRIEDFVTRLEVLEKGKGQVNGKVCSAFWLRSARTALLASISCSIYSHSIPLSFFIHSRPPWTFLFSRWIRDWPQSKQSRSTSHTPYRSCSPGRVTVSERGVRPRFAPNLHFLSIFTTCTFTCFAIFAPALRPGMHVLHVNNHSLSSIVCYVYPSHTCLLYIHKLVISSQLPSIIIPFTTHIFSRIRIRWRMMRMPQLLPRFTRPHGHWPRSERPHSRLGDMLATRRRC